MHENERAVGSAPLRLVGGEGMLEQREALLRVPRERVGVAQDPRHERGYGPNTPVAAQRKSALQQPNCLAEVSPGDVETPKAEACVAHGVGLIERLRDAKALAPMGDPFIEAPALGEKPRKIRTG